MDAIPEEPLDHEQQQPQQPEVAAGDLEALELTPKAGPVIAVEPGCVSSASRFPHWRSLDIPKDWAEMESGELVDQLLLVPSPDAGFPIVSPVAKAVVRNMEDLLRVELERAQFLEMEFPSVSRAELIERTGVFDTFKDEVMQLAEPAKGLILSATSEEPFLQYLELDPPQSYRRFPIKAAHFHDAFRWIARSKGYYSTREIHTCIMTHVSSSLDQYRESMAEFGGVCERFFEKIGIPVHRIDSDDGTAVEYYYDGSFGDRKLGTSVAVSKSLEESTSDVKSADTAMTSLSMGYPFKHTDKFDLSFQDTDGNLQTPHVGTCGIGIQRCFLALFDTARDEHGLKLPAEIRPWDIMVAPLDESSLAHAEEIGKQAAQNGMRVLLEDRVSRSFGQKLGVADFYGVPLRFVIGRKEAAAGAVEVRWRGERGKGEVVPIEELPAWLQSQRERVFSND